MSNKNGRTKQSTVTVPVPVGIGVDADLEGTHLYEGNGASGRVLLGPKEQAKLDLIASEYIAAQQQAIQAQQTLAEAQQSVEQQKGRMQGALEAILDRRDLDPATHRWDYDGKTVTLRAV